jgi:AcrR family transcriptional regulator
MRSLAHARIVHGAMAVLAVKGFDCTVDDVAVAAGVSRRTVFRHFATHGELLAAALEEILSVYDALFSDLDPPGADPDGWLEATVQAVHELNRRIVGRAFWDIHVDRSAMHREMQAQVEDMSTRRFRYARELADTAWPAFGGVNPAPDCVVDAFHLLGSGFATNAMAAYSPEQAGQVSARILGYVLTGALAEAGRSGAGAPKGRSGRK